MLGQSLCAVAFLVMLLLLTPAAAQERSKVFLGASSKTLGYSPLWVGAKRGLFEQQGLDVQLLLLRGVPMTLQALAAGSLQIGSGGPEPYIEASERGLDFAIAGGIINGMAQVLIAGKNYKTVEDLRRHHRRVLFDQRHGNRVEGSFEIERTRIPARLQTAHRRRRLGEQSFGIAVRPDHRNHGGGAAESCRRGARLQYPRADHRRGSQFSGRRHRHKALVGGKKPCDDGPLHESDGLIAPLAARQPRRRGGVYLQGNAAQTRSRAQGLGILHTESALAGGRRTEHRGHEK